MSSEFGPGTVHALRRLRIRLKKLRFRLERLRIRA